MDPVSALPWVFAGLLALIHHFGEHLNDTAFAHQNKIISFSVGVTVTYVFLQLLPEHHRGLEYVGEYGSLSILIGFSTIYLTEKWAYQHDKSFEALKQDFKEIHSAFLFLYYFVIGVLIYELIHQFNVVEGTLFFIPIMFHTAISSFSLIEVDEEILNNPIVRIGITIAVLLGTGAAALFQISLPVFYVLLGTVTGMFLYVVIHDAMPQRDAGRPLYFLLGLLFYSSIMAYIWMMV